MSVIKKNAALSEQFCASDSDSRHDQCSEYNIYFIDDQTYRWTSVGGSTLTYFTLFVK